MSLKELVEKFRECACYSVHPLSKGTVEQVVKMVGKLEDVNDMSQIIQLLCEH